MNKNNIIIIDMKCNNKQLCMHHLVINGEEELMSGEEIYNYLFHRNLEIDEHFIKYKKELYGCKRKKH
jgi:hypothetical protein